MKSKKNTAEPLDLAMRWAVALAAPIHEQNHLPLDTLGGYRRYGTVGDEAARESIAEQAGISSRSEARKVLPAYLEAGVATAHAKARSWRAGLPRAARAMGFLSLDTFELQVRQFVHDRAEDGTHAPNAPNAPSSPDPVAIDLARLVYYVGLASRAAFLTEPEAWALVARAAAVARKTYASWDDFARGFSYGRWVVAGSVDEGLVAEEKRVASLLTKPKSPWTTLPWDVDLSPLDALARPSSAANGPLKAVRVRVVASCPACLFPCLLGTVSEARCPECGASLEGVLDPAWAMATGLGDQADVDPEVEDRQGTDVWHLRSLGGHHTHVAHTKTGPVCACGSPITDDAVRSSISRGAVTCACGVRTPVAEAPPALRAVDWRARYVVGGPLRVGEPDGWITLLFDQA